MQENVASLLDLAAAAARAAGGELAGRSADWLSVDSDAGRDVKLAADRRSEAALAAALAESGLPVFSEESGWLVERRAHTPYWVIDPLDGTANYRAGTPLCCVSVALLDGDRPLAGVVYDFNRDELFSGGPGLGAFANGRPMAVGAASAKAAATLATGLTVNRDYSDAAMTAFASEIREWKKVRMIGSAALSLAWVAAGRFDAYAERAIMVWDVAAGWALVEGAGGVVRATVGQLSAPVDVFAANPSLALLS